MSKSSDLGETAAFRNARQSSVFAVKWCFIATGSASGAASADCAILKRRHRLARRLFHVFHVKDAKGRTAVGSGQGKEPAAGCGQKRRVKSGIPVTVLGGDPALPAGSRSAVRGVGQPRTAALGTPFQRLHARPAPHHVLAILASRQSVSLAHKAALPAARGHPSAKPRWGPCRPRPLLRLASPRRALSLDQQKLRSWCAVALTFDQSNPASKPSNFHFNRRGADITTIHQQTLADH